MLWNCKEEVLFMFFKYVGICDSNEVEVLAILEALRCFVRYLNDNVIVESDSSNAVAWVSNRRASP